MDLTSFAAGFGVAIVTVLVLAAWWILSSPREREWTVVLPDGRRELHASQDAAQRHAVIAAAQHQRSKVVQRSAERTFVVDVA